MLGRCEEEKVLCAEKIGNSRVEVKTEGRMVGYAWSRTSRGDESEGTLLDPISRNATTLSHQIHGLCLFDMCRWQVREVRYERKLNSIPSRGEHSLITALR